MAGEGEGEAWAACVAEIFCGAIDAELALALLESVGGVVDATLALQLDELAPNGGGCVVVDVTEATTVAVSTGCRLLFSRGGGA